MRILARFAIWVFTCLTFIGTSPTVVHASGDSAQNDLRPELVIGTGHTDEVLHIAVSPNGKMVATAGASGLVWIWDAKTGRAVLRFDFPESGGVFDALVEFSHNSQFLYAVNQNGIYKIDLKQRVVTDHVEYHLVFKSTPNLFTSLGEGKGFLLCDTRACSVFDDQTDEKWDRHENFLEVAEFEFEPLFTAYCGNHVLGFYNGEYGINDAESHFMVLPLNEGEENINIPTKQDATALGCGTDDTMLVGGRDGEVSLVDFNGTVLSQTQSHGNFVTAFLAMPNGETVVSTAGLVDARNAKLTFIDRQTLEVLRETELGGPDLEFQWGGSKMLAVSFDQDQLLVPQPKFSGTPESITRVSLFDLKKTPDFKRALLPAKYLRFDEDGDSLIVQTEKEIVTWDLVTGQASVPRSSQSYGFPRLARDTILAVNNSQALQELSLSGKARTFQKPEVWNENHWMEGRPAVSDTAIAIGYRHWREEGTVGGSIVWPDAFSQDGEKTPVFLPFQFESTTQPPEFSPDGKYMAQEGVIALRMGAKTLTAVEMYDLSASPPSRIWTSESEDWPGSGSTIDEFGVGFSTDGDHLILTDPRGRWNGGLMDSYPSLLILNSSDGSVNRTIDAAVPVHVATSGFKSNTAMVLENTKEGGARFLRDIDEEDPPIVPFDDVDAEIVVADETGTVLLISDGRRKVLLWNEKLEQPVRLDANVTASHNVAFSHDGATLALAEVDGSVSLWRSETGELLARLLILSNGDWAVIDADGRYDAADPGNVAGLSWILPSDPLTPDPIETYYLDYYEPRLLGRRLKAEAFPPLPSPAQRNRVVPDIRFTNILSTGRDTLGTNLADVTLALSEGQRRGQKSGLGDIKLYRDGQIVAVQSGVQFSSGDQTTVTFKDVKLPSDQSDLLFSAYAFNNDGIKSETIFEQFTQDQKSAPSGKRAYVIGVGINVYDNPSWNLSYAASDAEASVELIAEGLRNKGSFDEIHELSLVSKENNQERLARLDVIEAVLLQLAGAPIPETQAEDARRTAMKIPPARPQDLVYVTFAGHGLATSDGLFHFFTQEFGRGTTGRTLEEGSLEFALSGKRLADLLMQIDVRDMMLVIDACNSAASVEGQGFRPGPMGSRGLGQLAYDKSMIVLAASQSEDVALESDALAHGAMSYAMLREGLESGFADMAPQNGAVSFSEMFAFALDRVPDLFIELQQGTFNPKTRGMFSLVEELEESVAKPQRPALFDFRQRDALNIEMAAPQKN